MAPTTRSFTCPANDPISYYNSPPSLLSIVRSANARYSFIASSMRKAHADARISNARKRAALLNLTVNTDAARRLSQKHVSTVPLPIIEVGPSPTTSAPRPSLTIVIHAPQPKRPSLKSIISSCPQEQQAPMSITSASVSAFQPSAYDSPSNSYTSRTEGEQINAPSAPATIRCQGVPWRPVTSRWSISTAGEDDVDCQMDATSEEEPSPQPSIPDVPARPMAPLPGAQRKHTRSNATQIHHTYSQNRVAEPIHTQTATGKRKAVNASAELEQSRNIAGTDTETQIEKRPKYTRKTWAHASSSTFPITYNERGAF
ncbi:hypothetical protein CVT24_009439 [Panaeolus cyanescens]|uniref:Uncharacterized protein n=1 Tax=Panaeolus cyanescens TaxID=181874 RepID=A0A409W3N2_9AGAR|nr:hypothetical protein CVT24_009439 [Panaeolus cyanescens]